MLHSNDYTLNHIKLLSTKIDSHGTRIIYYIKNEYIINNITYAFVKYFIYEIKIAYSLFKSSQNQTSDKSKRALCNS